jgi:hypothetical protein
MTFFSLTGVPRSAWTSIFVWRCVSVLWLLHGNVTDIYPSVNIKEGDPNERPMTTGLHIVRDTFCVKCDAHVGWKYVSTLPCPITMIVMLFTFCQALAFFFRDCRD